MSRAVKVWPIIILGIPFLIIDAIRLYYKKPPRLIINKHGIQIEIEYNRQYKNLLPYPIKLDWNNIEYFHITPDCYPFLIINYNKDFEKEHFNNPIVKYTQQPLIYEYQGYNYYSLANLLNSKLAQFTNKELTNLPIYENNPLKHFILFKLPNIGFFVIACTLIGLAILYLNS